MNEAFVPVHPSSTKARLASEPFRLAVTPSVEGAREFVPAKPQPRIPESSSTPACEPEISLTRQGDRISRITLRCSCGQVIELDCAY
jgi:hypothetical protein